MTDQERHPAHWPAGWAEANLPGRERLLRLTRDTIVVRLADYGELGMSHGLREKSYTAYEEMIHIPFIVSNPVLFPDPATTRAFYSHLDLLPTLADLAGIPPDRRPGLGTSVVPVRRDPRASVQDSVLYSYDDVCYMPADTPGGHIRALREGDWTYAVYFGSNGSGLDYELYELVNDPGQLVNLLAGDPPPAVRREWNRLHAKLTTKLDVAANLPSGFAWPAQPSGAQA
jgi:choline-sulfatase